MKGKYNQISNNRINFLIAIVFLFGLLIVYRLYDLQVMKYDLYMARAQGQHQIHNILEPERGEIFMEDHGMDGQVLSYPFATNKDFALLYAVPRDIEDAKKTADKLFDIFDRGKVKKEVDEYFKEQDEKELEFQLKSVAYLPDEQRFEEENRIKDDLLRLWQDSAWLKLRQEKKEAEIERRKEEYIDRYLKILSKKNDPYEPLSKKVGEEELKEVYAILLSGENNEISTSSLAMKDGRMFKRTGKEIGGEEELEPVSYPGISHIMKKYRYYPEEEMGAHILGFVSLESEDKKGKYGLEGFFNNELSGSRGEVKSEMGAKKDIIIVNDRQYSEPKDGSDLMLTIDRPIQFTACKELKESMDKFQADSGTVLIMEPFTGAILALCSYPSYDPNDYGEVEEINVFNNPIIFEQYEPGSVFKTLTMAAAMNEGKISPSTIYEDKGSIMIQGWDKPIRNSDFSSKGAHGWVDMNYALSHSLNTGSIFAMKQIGAEIFSDYVVDFGFGQKTGIELETEVPGDIRNLKRKKIRPAEAATASYGQGITVTPLQLVSAYAAIANDGILMKPYIVKEIVYDDGARFKTRPVQIRRVVSERTANLTLGMLANVVEGGHAKLAGVEGYYVGGKTGTAEVASKKEKGYSEDETIHNFVGLAPINDPRFVMLTKLNNPKVDGYSASTAAPLFGEIAEFILNYYQVPKER